MGEDRAGHGAAGTQVAEDETRVRVVGDQLLELAAPEVAAFGGPSQPVHSQTITSAAAMVRRRPAHSVLSPLKPRTGAPSRCTVYASEGPVLCTTAWARTR